MKKTTQSSNEGNRQKEQKTAVITGAGEGLGRSMALTLAARGYKVYGTALTLNEVEELAIASANKVKLFVTDITDEEAVRNFVGKVSGEISNNGLDLLISNAGILTPGPMEALTIDQLRHEWEIDVFGAVRIINSFLPSLRTARGRIIAVSSYSGKFSVPFSGPSSATKHTIEALADAYRTELKPSGVSFTVVEPGNMKTNAPAKSAAAIRRMREGMKPELLELYGDAFQSFEDAFNGLQDSGLPSDTAAQMIIDVAELEVAPARVPIGEEAARVIKMAHETPDNELDKIRLSFLGLDKLPQYASLLNTKEQNVPLDPISVVRKNTEEVQGKGNYEVFDQLFSKDFIDHTPQPGGFSADREGAKALYKKLREAFPDFHADIHWQTTDGVKVTTFKTYHGTHLGSFWGMEPTGKKIQFETVDVMSVHEGKITEHWGVANLFSLAQQFGLGPNLVAKSTETIN